MAAARAKQDNCFRDKMIKQRRLLFLSVLLPFYFLTCGIDVNYYLPQVSQGNINRTANTEAEIILPRLSNNPDYSSYSPSYSIFYRIYISNLPLTAEIQQSDMSNINSTLSNDFSNFFSLTDPTNFSSLANSSTFRNRNYHELELENASLTNVLGNGGTFRLVFQPITGERPVIIDTGRIDPETNAEYTRYLFRSSGSGNNNGIIFTPEPDRYFFYSPELVEETHYPIVTGGNNNDVALRRNNSKEESDIGHAYVSMYVVAVGVAPDFSRVLSKPTHIGVFKLPDVN